VVKAKVYAWFALPRGRVRGRHLSHRSGWRQRAIEYAWPSMGARAWLRWALLNLLRQAEHPHKIALGFAIGVWVSFTPILGTHLLIAGLACWLLRANFFAAFMGSWVGNPWTYYAMWWSGYEVGRRLLGLPPVNIEKLLEGSWSLPILVQNAEVLAQKIVLPALVGGWLVGVPVGAIFYFAVRWQVRKLMKNRRKRLLHKQKGRR
jgi:uncharacterized protein